MKLKKLIPFSGHGDKWFCVFGHPYFIARINLSRSLKQLVSSLPESTILDVGCGSMPYRYLFGPTTQYFGLEIDHPRNYQNPCVTHFYDGSHMPFPDNTFDHVICSQVLEHSFNPEVMLAEIFRVMKKGSSMYLSVPFIWPEHEQPFDSQRFTSFGLISRLNRIGFDVDILIKSTPSLSAHVQLFIDSCENLVLPVVNTTYKLFIWRLVAFLPYTFLNLLAIPFFKCQSLSTQPDGPAFYLDIVLKAFKQ
jgi:SAM-dependent methyltransferase